MPCEGCRGKTALVCCVALSDLPGGTGRKGRKAVSFRFAATAEWTIGAGHEKFCIQINLKNTNSVCRLILFNNSYKRGEFANLLGGYI
jgi:hypothetical protein